MGEMLSTMIAEDMLWLPETTKKFLATKSCFHVAMNLGSQNMFTAPSHQWGGPADFLFGGDLLVTWNEHVPFTCQSLSPPHPWFLCCSQNCPGIALINHMSAAYSRFPHCIDSETEAIRGPQAPDSILRWVSKAPGWVVFKPGKVWVSAQPQIIRKSLRRHNTK